MVFNMQTLADYIRLLRHTVSGVKYHIHVSTVKAIDVAVMALALYR